MRNVKLLTSLLVLGLMANGLYTQRIQRPISSQEWTEEHPNDFFQSPSHRTCGTMDILEEKLGRNPTLRQELDRMELDYQKYLNNSSQRRVATPVTIPVVVHVIYSSNPNLVSDAMIQSQIDVLNADYSMTNSDASSVPTAFQGVAAATNIQFCLASRDENGNASTGIVRIQSTLTNHNKDDQAQLKALSQWDPTQYLNIWVTESIANGILGYATFPFDIGSSPQLDGVVVARPYFGVNSFSPFNKGRTVTHEVGHWLGLFHTFQDGCSGMTQSNCAIQGDLVCDTPPASSPAYGCPGIRNSCSESYPSNLDDMTMNYMDYVDDACMYMFTQGQ